MKGKSKVFKSVDSSFDNKFLAANEQKLLLIQLEVKK